MTQKKVNLTKGELIELMDEMAEELRRRRVTARMYVVGGACMALAYGEGRATNDVDARIDTGHGALLEAAREIARRRGLPDGWLNEQATTAIPKTPDKRAHTLYESRHLVVTGASAEYLLAMKLEAGRNKDTGDIEILLRKLNIADSDTALALHRRVLPDSKRRTQARAVLTALARRTTELAAPTAESPQEEEWLRKLTEQDEFPKFEVEQTAQGFRIRMQEDETSESETIGEKLTAQRAALVECDARGWPSEAVDVIKGFRAVEDIEGAKLSDQGKALAAAAIRGGGQTGIGPEEHRAAVAVEAERATEEVGERRRIERAWQQEGRARKHDKRRA